MILRRLLSLPLFALTATTALAQEDPMCRNGLFPGEPPFALVKVIGSERARFRDDNDGCPWASKACATGSYVVPGDTLIVSKVRKGFACAFYPETNTAGWLPTRQLALQFTDTTPPLDAWTGTWSSQGNPVVRIRRDLGVLRVAGEAWWPGPPGTHDYPSTHEGQLDGTIAVAGRTGSYEDENDCEVTFSLIGDYLLSSSNANCGGANVNFTAVYEREGR